VPNIAYFEIPADNVDRAKQFYQSLLGWKIEPTTAAVNPEMVAATQYQDIIMGEPQEGTINMGGMYKRQMSEPITSHVMVENLEEVLAKVEKLGGKIITPTMDMQSVGLDAIIQDTEGNTIGLWQPAKK